MALSPAGNLSQSSDRRDVILDAALQVSCERGYFRTSIDDITARAGIVDDHLTGYMPSTGELLLAIVYRRDSREGELVRVFDQVGGLELLPGLKALVRGNKANRNTLLFEAILGGECMFTDHPAHEWAATRMRWLRSLFAGALRRDMDAGLIRDDIDAALVAGQIAAVIHGLIPQWLIDPDEVDIAEVFDHFVDRLIDQITVAR